MPFYEYECTSCKFYKEVMQKVSEAPLRKCPSCGRNTLKKLVSAPVFRLKGAGWYETDFKSDKEHKRNLAEKEPEAKDSSDAKPVPAAADSKTEAKVPDKAADAKTEKAKPAEGKAASESKHEAASSASRRSTRTVKKSVAKTRPKPKPARRKGR